MDSEVGVIVRVAVFDGNVVADLKADSVTVVVAGFEIANRVSIAVLQKDAAAVVAVQVGRVFSITVEGQILDRDVGGVFAGEEWKQGRARRLTAEPQILSEAVTQFESITAPADQRSFDNVDASVVRVLRFQNDSVTDSQTTTAGQSDLLIVPVRVINNVNGFGCDPGDESFRAAANQS